MQAGKSDYFERAHRPADYFRQKRMPVVPESEGEEGERIKMELHYMLDASGENTDGFRDSLSPPRFAASRRSPAIAAVTANFSFPSAG